MVFTTTCPLVRVMVRPSVRGMPSIYTLAPWGLLRSFIFSLNWMAAVAPGPVVASTSFDR